MVGSSTTPSQTFSILLPISIVFQLLGDINSAIFVQSTPTAPSLPLAGRLPPPPSSINGSCLESERAALLRFKAGLDDLTNTHLISWRGLDCCTWEGITCNNLTGSVVNIDLGGTSTNSSGMRVVDFSSLLQLRSLQHLDLSGNSFNHVPLPDLIGSFEELRYLNLSRSGFAGAVPPQLGNLSRLQYLDLSHDIHQPGLLRVDSLRWLSGLPSLRFLALDGADLSAVGPHDWAHTLNQRLPSLCELHLRGCRLGGELASSLGRVNFTSLEVIDLSSNPFSSSKIPSWLLNMSNLRYVDMSSMSLHGPIPLSFSELPYLQHLNLDNNENLTANVSELLGGGHGGWPRLDTLRIRHGSLYGEVPASIGNITSLRQLYLSFNNVGGTIPSSIGNLHQLEALYLSLNKIVGELPPTIWHLPALIHLFVAGNRLTGVISEAHLSYSAGRLQRLSLGDNFLVLNISSDWIPPFQLNYLNAGSCQMGPAFPSWIKNQRGLMWIFLSDNRISSEIPGWLWDLPSKHDLRVFNLSGNSLTGSIPVSIGELRSLEALDLSQNKLTGSIPTAVEQLRNLWTLQLSTNNLSGGIPACIGDLHRLQILDLSGNNLTGGIPESIGRLRNLRSLSLSWNNLEGSIPISINGQLQNLRIVDFSRNNLTGDIPESITELRNLTYLDLSGNNMTAVIPTSVGVLQNLEFLDLSGNNLTGGVPIALCNCPNLTSLKLTGNKVSGEIPACIGNLKRLQVFDLSSNELMGGIPTSVLSCLSLQFLNLGGNNLSGDIPTSPFVSMKDLKTLDLAYNKLHGNIPVWMENIPRLKILRLRSNKFSGEIPCQLANLKSLQVLDLAKNNLTGPIPHQLGNLSGMTLRTTQQRSYFEKREYYVQTIAVHMKGSDLHFVFKTIFLITSIDLSGNSLSGGFPESLINLSGLVVLDMSRNFLTGTIPERIGNMRELQSLDLSNNYLMGRIPPSMRYMSFLSFLNLSNNNLSGEIPAGGQMDTFDEASFLGNPFLCGVLFLQRNCPREDPQLLECMISQDEGAVLDVARLALHGYGKWVCLWSFDSDPDSTHQEKLE
ncbi:hypothetical protein Taro_009766 [Colocasia esculenta]|uniref:Leucine-rich repeat-containing N-terminal plant-type domain-containing protein n=1 Tax=Colocasia esculenta TaxID=4460 RepID=A0A843U4Y6_COLES|nr:hypothetical protein [Colocasia esculenta]